MRQNTNFFIFFHSSILHGLGRLTGPPRFWIFFLFPGLVFIIDKMATLRTRYMKLDILETELLPSDVVKVKFYRPPNMKVLSGQWIRFSCTGIPPLMRNSTNAVFTYAIFFFSLAIEPEEFHSFTLTSAPHEDFLSVHIKSIGPFTWRLRN